MKVSKYAKWVKVSDKDKTYALFNNILMQIVFVSEDELNDILEMQIPKYEQKLKEIGFYVDDDKIVDTIFDDLRDSIKKQSKKLSIMYLNISTFCNLACKYCFIENNPISKNCPQKMDIKTAKIAVDKFVDEINKNSAEDAQIIIYGGEPLTNFQLLKEIVSYIRKKKKELAITTITNGTLLTEKHVKFFMENKVGLGLSLDGPKFINDKNRVFRSEDGSVYDAAIKSVKLLNEMGCNYCISATATNDVINNQDIIYDWIKESGFKNIFWNLYHYSSKSDDWEEFYKKMSDAILNMYNKLDNIGVDEERVKEQIKLFLDGKFKFHNCGAVGLNQITVQPNGNICICQGDSKSSDTIVGNIISDSIEEILNNIKNKEWLEIYTLDRDECRYCEAISVCGGGCPLQAEALFGNRKDLDRATCIYYKNSLEWLLKQYYEANKD